MLDFTRIDAILFDLDSTLMKLQGGQKGGQLANWLQPLAPLLPNREPHATVRRLFVISDSPDSARF